MTIRVLLVTVLVGLAAACGGGSDTYSLEETRVAFASEGYELVERPPDPSEFVLNPWSSGETVERVPSDGALFRVYIGEVDAASAVSEGPDFQAHSGNVLVISTGELDASHRARIQAALEALPGDDEVTTVAE